MKIGFWNIGKNGDDSILNLIDGFSKDLDILILLECIILPVEILGKLNNISTNFYYLASIISDTYFLIFTKIIGDYIPPILESKRIIARKVINEVWGDFTLIAIHFQSKLFWDDSNQDAHSFEIKIFIDEVENTVGHDRTIILGDFNMNPFQNGMLQTTGLHATMDKKMARKVHRVVADKKYKFFYNPMWSFFGEKGKGTTNGTYYYSSSKPICYFWNILDQVLIRPSLIDNFDEESLNIITEINGVNLLKMDGIIDNSISDHLPITFELLLKQ